MKKSVSDFILRWIDDHLEQNIQIEKISIITGYSKRCIHNYFKDQTGVTIGKHIKNRRLSRTAILLRLTSLSITNIALSSGFDSVQSFSREFKKYFLITPSAYRNSNLWNLSYLHHIPHRNSKYKPKVCTIKAKNISGFNIECKTPALETETSLLKWGAIMNALKKWESDVFCTSSFVYEIYKENTTLTPGFIGIDDGGGSLDFSEQKKTKVTIKKGKYVKINFSGDHSEYKRFFWGVYMDILPQNNIIRMDGDDIEVFKYNECKIKNKILSFDYYIPVEINSINDT